MVDQQPILNCVDEQGKCLEGMGRVAILRPQALEVRDDPFKFSVPCVLWCRGVMVANPSFYTLSRMSEELRPHYRVQGPNQRAVAAVAIQVNMNHMHAISVSR
jgi:hypothetical protein